MANTTNFGWETPDDTDLVKDGAAAMRTLGNAIDTSFVDLKGGTTGQILSKASNTDLDYTWVSPNPGDITGVTATSPLTGGGTSGDVTVGIQDGTTSQKGAIQLEDSVSSTSTTKAATPNSVKTVFDAVGFTAGKNKIINGDFGIWQRGTTFTSPANGAYTADRWRTGFDGNGTCTISRQAFTAGTAPVAGYEGEFFLRHLVTAAGTTTFTQIFQPIEDVRTFAGQTVTFSFWAKAETSRSVFIYAEQVFGSGGSATVQYLSMGNANLTTSWQRFSFTVALSSISGKTIGTGSSLNFYIRNGTTLNAQLDLWGVQLEAGSTASIFQTATGNKASELQACQRYYYRALNDADNRSLNGLGWADSSTTIVIQTTFPVPMRIRPTAVETTGTAANYLLAGAGLAANATAVTYDGVTTDQVGCTVFTISGGGTAGRVAQLRSSGANRYIAWSAEL